jgi:hypothetical protein
VIEKPIGQKGCVVIPKWLDRGTIDCLGGTQSFGT